MRYLTPVALACILAATPASAQAPIHVPDLRALGFGWTIPEPAEIDGNPKTLEFILAGRSALYLINPRREQVYTGSGRLCYEPVDIPFVDLAHMIVSQTTRTINGRTWILTVGHHLLTGAQPYSLAPATFRACR